MALTITSGPPDWSVSETNGKKFANFQWEGHPDFDEGEEYYIRYEARLNGNKVDVRGDPNGRDILDDVPYIINKCFWTPEPEGSVHMDGEQLAHIFTVGSWVVQMFFCRNNEWRKLTEEDEEYIETNNDMPPDWVGEEVLEESNCWVWEVTE